MAQIRVQDEQGNIHVFPPEATPEMMAQALNVKPPQTQVPTASVSAPPKLGSIPWLKSTFYNAADKMSRGLPAAGATAGALIGGGVGTGAAPGLVTAAGAVGGAGIGGMAGEAGERLLRQTLGFDQPQAPGPQAGGIAKQGAIQGGVQAATEALPFLAPALRNAAVGQYTRALAPTTKINKAIAQDIAPELIQRGEMGSLGGLEQKAAGKIAEIKPQLDTEYQQLQAASPKLPTRNQATGRMVQGTQGQIPASGNKVIADLEAAKGQYMAGGQVADPVGVQAISDVQDIVKQYGPNISPTTLRELRQVFENPVAKAGGFAGADLSTKYALNAREAASNSIRSILNSSPSDIGTLNREISFWLDVQRVTRDSALRKTGQEGLWRTIGPIAAGTAASATGMRMGGQAGLEAGVGTALATAGYQAVRSPMWRTASAVLKDRFANALASGDVGQATALLGRFGIAAAGSGTNNQQGAPKLPWQQATQPSQ